MKFTILIYEPPANFAARQADGLPNPTEMAAYYAYSKALQDAGAMVGGSGLLPPRTATTVRLRDGSRHVQDGPFADTKEQLGGYYVIDVPDLDAALSWAARCPAAASGSIEVRPNMPGM